MSNGFGFIAKSTESIWMLSYPMKICIKAAFTQMQPGLDNIFVPGWVKKFYLWIHFSVTWLGPVQEFEPAMQEICKTRQAERVDAKALQGETELARGQVKDAFAHFGNLRAACPRKLSPILNDDGNLISDKMAKAHRWKNYFEQLLNHPPVPCPVFHVMHRKITMDVWNHQNPRFILLFENWRMAK